MITLYQFDRIWNIANPSPFCMKLETYLRINKIEYNICSKPKDVFRSPSGKVPYIKDNGKVINDSSFIIKYLNDKYNIDPDKNLTNEERSVSFAFKSMIEEQLYWVLVYTRWFMETNSTIVKRDYFKQAPSLLRNFLFKFVQGKIRKQINGHGLGKHSEEKIFEIGFEIIDSISDYLNDKKYFNGDHITSIDYTLFAFLESIINSPIKSPVNEYTLKKANITNYCNRIRNEYYSDLTN